MTSRRHFIAAASALPFLRLPSRAHAQHDLVLRGATVFDGTGEPGRIMDVAVAGGKIVEAGTVTGRGLEERDLRGLALAPGFIDIHSHADGALWGDARMESVIRQGITTVVGGQDGGSRPIQEVWAKVAVEKPGANVAMMVGLGSVRGTVVGEEDRPATAEEMRQMVEMVERALEAGACGASSGLEYTPGAFASRDELVTLCRPLARRRLCYATHMRNEDDRLLEAIDEAIAVAEGAGCRLEVSHLKTQGPRNWPRIDDALARFTAARARGLDAMFDRYPYVAYQTTLANLFPASARDGGTAAFLARLDDPALKQACLAKVDLIGGWDNVLVSSVRAESLKAAEGQRLGTFAASRETDPFDMTVRLLRESDGGVGMVGFAMSEENLERFLAHPLGMVCSDGGAFATEGPARRGHPHPRGIGSFPRVLGRYVRERNALTLEAAVHKMSGQPASRLNLADRGGIAPGLNADLVAFDAATVIDRATFEDPWQYPAGIRLVVVNGRRVLEDDTRLDGQGGAGTVAAPKV